MNQGMAGNGFLSVPTVEEPTGGRRGASRRKKKRQLEPWWTNVWPVPTRKKKDEPLPHEVAIEAARDELAEVRQKKAAPPAEMKRLTAQLGNIVRSANALERKIEEATEAADVADRYRALQTRVIDYTKKLDDLQETRIRRLRAEDDRLLQTIMEMD